MIEWLLSWFLWISTMKFYFFIYAMGLLAILIAMGGAWMMMEKAYFWIKEKFS